MLWEDNYLAHYGIKGQRWGVRRFQNPDGSLTAAGKEHYSIGSRMDRLYGKQNKKLKKLGARADLDTQRKDAEKYESRANKARTVAGAAGAVGIAAGLASMGLKDAVTQTWSMNVAGKNLGPYTTVRNAKEGARKAAYETTAMIALPTAAVALGAAVYNGIKARTAKKYSSAIGHDRAVIKYQKQIDKMTKMFADTPYADLIKK